MTLPSRNVVVFGETGVGKSSIINMLSDKVVALTSNGATGCTFTYQSYPVKLSESFTYNLYDTVGTNEGDSGKVVDAKAIANSFRLITDLQDGVHLLVYCIRAPRITEVTQRNWKLFYEYFCKKRVPIVIVITGLENEIDMGGWWNMNEETFKEYGMQPDGHACVTAIKGNGGKLEERYRESRTKVRSLLEQHSLERGWKKDRNTWFARFWRDLGHFFPLPTRFAMIWKLSQCGISKRDAIALLDSMKQDSIVYKEEDDEGDDATLVDGH